MNQANKGYLLFLNEALRNVKAIQMDLKVKNPALAVVLIGLQNSIDNVDDL